MSATTAPTVTLNVTDSAATEIKKFMTGEEDLPESAGLRVRVVPGGCSGFQYSLNIEEQSREGDFVFDETGADFEAAIARFMEWRLRRDEDVREGRGGESDPDVIAA